jgi:hypothetical protein
MESPEEEMKSYFLRRKEPSERCASASSHDEDPSTVTGLCLVQKSTSSLPFNGNYEKD